MNVSEEMHAHGWPRQDGVRQLDTSKIPFFGRIGVRAPQFLIFGGVVCQQNVTIIRNLFKYSGGVVRIECPSREIRNPGRPIEMKPAINERFINQAHTFAVDGGGHHNGAVLPILRFQEKTMIPRYHDDELARKVLDPRHKRIIEPFLRFNDVPLDLLRKHIATDASQVTIIKNRQQSVRVRHRRQMNNRRHMGMN